VKYQVEEMLKEKLISCFKVLSEHLLEGVTETTKYVIKYRESIKECFGIHWQPSVDGQPAGLRRSAYMFAFKGDQLKHQHSI
jgi:hypothetical protein